LLCRPCGIFFSCLFAPSGFAGMVLAAAVEHRAAPPTTPALVAALMP
jgi:hypothetical protein